MRPIPLLLFAASVVSYRCSKGGLHRQGELRFKTVSIITSTMQIWQRKRSKVDMPGSSVLNLTMRIFL